MLTYNYGKHEPMTPIPFRSCKHTILYDPPIEEFSVLYTTLAAKEEEVHEAIDGPSIFIATSGSGTVLAGAEALGFKEGAVFFIGAGTKVWFRADGDGLGIHRAFVEAPVDASSET